MADTEGVKSPPNSKLLKLPLARIKTITKSSPGLSNVSQDAYFLIARATELFTQHLAEESFKVDSKVKDLPYDSLATLVSNNDYLDFLEDITPHKITMKEYWAKMEKKNKESSSDDKIEESDEK